MKKKKSSPVSVPKFETPVLLQGIKFRDTLIISCKGGRNTEIFDKLGDFDVVMIPAVILGVDTDFVSQKIDHSFLSTARIDQIMTSHAKPKIEGIPGKKNDMYFNSKEIKQKDVNRVLNILNLYQRKKVINDLLEE